MLSACNQKNSQKMSNPTPGDNSRTSLDWPGTYMGILPCANCEGILTEVRLKADNTYEIATQYLSKSKEINRKKGAIEWDASGNSIRLVGANQPSGDLHYQVGENWLLQLDPKGNRIEGELADLYRLAKYNSDSDVREKYWKLIELRGKPISLGEEQQREAHLILKFDGRIVGSTGCNRMMGSYTLENENRIRFSQIASTLMACYDVPYEQDFLRALEQVDNYTLQKDTLSLAKADNTTPLARFVVVYLH